MIQSMHLMAVEVTRGDKGQRREGKLEVIPGVAYMPAEVKMGMYKEGQRD